MAQLIKCPTCGKEISSESPTCPHCGQYNKPYIRKELKNLILKILIFGLIWAIAVHVFIFAMT